VIMRVAPPVARFWIRKSLPRIRLTVLRLMARGRLRIRVRRVLAAWILPRSSCLRSPFSSRSDSSTPATTPVDEEGQGSLKVDRNLAGIGGGLVVKKKDEEMEVEELVANMDEWGPVGTKSRGCWWRRVGLLVDFARTNVDKIVYHLLSLGQQRRLEHRLHPGQMRRCYIYPFLFSFFSLCPLQYSLLDNAILSKQDRNNVRGFKIITTGGLVTSKAFKQMRHLLEDEIPIDSKSAILRRVGTLSPVKTLFPRRMAHDGPVRFSRSPPKWPDWTGIWTLFDTFLTVQSGALCSIPVSAACRTIDMGVFSAGAVFRSDYERSQELCSAYCLLSEHNRTSGCVFII
jgi:hypothetical protein